jgi:hypothetical protein
MPTPDICRDQIEAWAAILASLASPAVAATVLEEVAAELKAIQPVAN